MPLQDGSEDKQEAAQELRPRRTACHGRDYRTIPVVEANFYDALYIALAIREDLKVLTADGGLVAAFEKLDRTVHLADIGTR